MDDAQLRTVWQQRQHGDTSSHLSGPLAMLMKHTLQKRVRQLSQLAGAWDEVVPDEIRDHTALDSFNKGTLTVMVDSAAHRFQLQMLLNSGTLRQLQARFAGAINKVRLVPGQFYSVDFAGEARYQF